MRIRQLSALPLLALLAAAPIALAAQGLPRATPEEVGLSPAALALIAPALQTHVDSGRFSGFTFAVARHGKLAFEGAVGMQSSARGVAMKTDALFRIYSMTKAVTAAAVMQQVERGRLRVEDPVSTYLPAFAQTRVFVGGSQSDPVLTDLARPITVEDLLLHTAGLTYGAFSSTPVDMMYREARLLRGDQTLEQFADAIAALPLMFQPGQQWNYSMAMDVLARVVEVTSLERYDRYLAANLFTPLGMRETAHHVPAAAVSRLVVMDSRGPRGELRAGNDSLELDLRDEGQIFGGGAGLVSTMADYLRFAQMLLNGGELDGARVLSKASVATLMRNHLPPRLTPQPSMVGMKGYGQGYGGVVLVDSALSKMPASPGTYRWCGYAGTYFLIDPKRDLIAMVWGQVAGGCPSRVSADFERLVYAALTGN